MFSSVALVDQRGELLLYRAFRDDVSVKSTTNFAINFIESHVRQKLPPVQLLQDTVFLFVQEGAVFLVGACRQNANAAMLLSFLKQLGRTIRERVANTAAHRGVLTEEAVKQGVAQVYEILDECFDYGIPQVCEPSLLKKCLVVEGTRLDSCTAKQIGDITTLVTSASVPLRSRAIKHMKNEVWLDITEKLNVLATGEGAILSAEVEGVVEAKSRLSGLPLCQLGLNEPLPLQRNPHSLTFDYVHLHSCVKLDPGTSEISFTPPDGKITLLQYRATGQLQVPLHFTTHVIEKSRTRVEYAIRLRGIATVHKLLIRIPCPPNSVRMNLIGCESGQPRFLPERREITWNLRKLAAGREMSLFCQVERLCSLHEVAWKKDSAILSFNMPMVTASGLTVRSLRVTEPSNYDTAKWIRYMTSTGTYQVRM